jgi:hypothetical protein
LSSNLYKDFTNKKNHEKLPLEAIGAFKSFVVKATPTQPFNALREKIFWEFWCEIQDVGGK